MKNVKGYRTVLFNVAVLAVGTVALLNPDVASELPDEQQIKDGVDATVAAIVFIAGVGNLLLRTITNTPIFRKD
jgi:hypothetical protein